MDLSESELELLLLKMKPYLKSQSKRWRDRDLFMCLAQHNIYESSKSCPDSSQLKSYSFKAVSFTHSIIARESKEAPVDYVQPIKSTDNPACIAIDKEENEILSVSIDKAIESLPSQQREVIKLYKEGNKIAEIAKKLRNNAKNVSQLYRTARKQMILLLEEDGFNLTNYKRAAEM